MHERTRRSAEKRAAAVAELSLALAELTSDPRELDQDVVRRVGDVVGDAAALWRQAPDGGLVLAAFHHADAAVREHMARLSAVVTHRWESGVLPHAWSAPGPLVLGSDVLPDWIPLMQPAYQEYARTHGMVSLVVVPLRVRGSTLALLGVSRDRPPEHDEDDVALVEQVAAVTAVALENRRLLESLERQLDEQRRLHQAAHRAALHDPLTGLPNRRLLIEQMTELAPNGGRASLLLVDLDGFKHVNDFYGHGVGDGVLVEVAARLSEVVATSGREPVPTLVRLGGDEFAVLVTGEGTEAAAVALSEDVLGVLEEPLHAVDARASLSASIGIASGPDSRAAELLHHADIAMYRAKRQGGGWTVYDPATDEPARLRLRDVGELQEALTRDELVVHFQPVVARRRRTGRQQMEVLVRWDHPGRGLLQPRDFLPLAASTGLMAGLTEQVLDQALDAVVSWRGSGLDVQVSVNMTAETVSELGLVQHLRDELSARSLPPDALCVELTESEALVTSAVGSLHELRGAGIDVAIDDFGTGYSSLAYLADLPFDRLKLDMSFVQRIGDDPRIQKLVGGLVECVHGLGHGVVAEGVEQAGQSAVLDRLGVEWQQGFLFGRPLPSEDATDWLVAHR